LAVDGDDLVILVKIVELERGWENTLAKGFVRLIDQGFVFGGSLKALGLA
jgi:hypothetical protein